MSPSPGATGGGSCSRQYKARKPRKRRSDAVGGKIVCRDWCGEFQKLIGNVSELFFLSNCLVFLVLKVPIVSWLTL
ncbi:MAG: hypothetical protein LBJ67_00105 [Planctomycetaceae bacterium]|nr:hypothetical protein [Planctomycetaceae bacterium]